MASSCANQCYYQESKNNYLVFEALGYTIFLEHGDMIFMCSKLLIFQLYEFPVEMRNFHFFM